MSRYLIDAESVDELIFQTIGAASMLWDHPENAGVFHAGSARELGLELKARLELDDGTS